MTDSEIQFKAIDYLLNLELWVWHDFRNAPQDCYQRIYTLIDTDGIMPTRRCAWHYTLDSMFILTIPGEFKMGANEFGCSSKQSITES
jgi:hypothetical protein